MFEFDIHLPRESQMKIFVYDHDLIGADDVVGSTTIDLEDRYLTWKHAGCGVSKQYIVWVLSLIVCFYWVLMVLYGFIGF